jgi:hypothetical protein
MVDTSGGLAFAKLIFMFTVTPYDGTSEQKLALVQYYHPVQSSHSDALVGFPCLQLAPPNETKIISLESIIQGAHIVLTFGVGSADKYHINDLVDQDVCLCHWKVHSRTN